MILDCAQYSGPCSCGREHPLETKMVVVEYDALKNFDEYMDRCGLSGRRTVLYDTNTYNLPGVVHLSLIHIYSRAFSGASASDTIRV